MMLRCLFMLIARRRLLLPPPIISAALITFAATHAPPIILSLDADGAVAITRLCCYVAAMVAMRAMPLRRHDVC